jgi:hypothetical protein
LTGVVRSPTGQTCAGTSVALSSKTFGETLFSPLATVTTDGNGRFTLVVRPMMLTVYSATTPDGMVRSQLIDIRVYTRITLDSPPAPSPVGSARLVANPVTFVGHLSPAYGAVAVGLGTYVGGRFVVLQQTTTDQSGGFGFSRILRAGPGTYVVFTSEHGGNDKGAKSLALEVT